eukprot:TRINITY_DN9842_c0_g3_i3.p2 TRINITY_DN9842_c0_g3~~TRINITY_DN9842_c0_g3_i3.p2  ORF type:complete len:306 (-),score=35.02 TRINITY_DN9842_c0_g3_i3:210-1073(-)
MFHLPGASIPFIDLLKSIKESLNKPSSSNGLDEQQSTAPTPSILVMGPPGVGKTTLLRDIAYLLSEQFNIGKRVVVVDSSMEMGGESRVPHECLGRARRHAVSNRDLQYKELQNVVQNQNPRVIIVDEVRDEQEVRVIRDISQRGVVMVATIHCPNLGALLKNNALRDLVGGVKSVTVGDLEARKHNQGIKNRMERGGAPVFQYLIEVLTANSYRVYKNVARSVDDLLGGRNPTVEERQFNTETKQVVAKNTNKSELFGMSGSGSSAQLSNCWLQDLMQKDDIARYG